MKDHLYIQRGKGKLLKNIMSCYEYISGGENEHETKLYALDGSWLIGGLFITDISIGADGIIFKGFETKGDIIYYLEWWFEQKGGD